jgi:hypothetical protein
LRLYKLPLLPADMEAGLRLVLGQNTVCLSSLATPAHLRHGQHLLKELLQHHKGRVAAAGRPADAVLVSRHSNKACHALRCSVEGHTLTGACLQDRHIRTTQVGLQLTVTESFSYALVHLHCVTHQPEAVLRSCSQPLPLHSSTCASTGLLGTSAAPLKPSNAHAPALPHQHPVCASRAGCIAP